MGKLVVTTNVTLDGVMQAPGRPDEDTRGGFSHGGWAGAYTDEVMAKKMGEGMRRPGAMLFGRWTYTSFYDSWAHRTDGNPFTEKMNNTTKYVASNTLTEPLTWQNSVVVSGDAANWVADFKKESDLSIIGSGELVQSLARQDLIDCYTLLIFPLVLGSGRRLFADGTPPANLRLVDSVPTTTGVIIATYEPAR